jgi:hypothetical protein
MRSWLRQVRETRQQAKTEYASPFLLWTGLMLFLLKLGARRQIAFEFDSPMALENLNRLAGSDQKTVPHSDTLDHFLGHVPPGQLLRLRRKMIHRLIRMKALDHARLRGHFLIVVDGTGQLTFRTRHCPHCLQQRVGDQVRYYHHVLEAKLVTPGGLALSVGSEFIENTDPNASKQDCELKAFGRLAERLKKNFPQLRLCLCLDALYAAGGVLEICEQHHWKYLIVFKEGSLPAVWQEYQTLRDLCPQNRARRALGDQGHQDFAWVDRLEYVDDRKRTHRFAAFECREHDGKDTHFFAWITNFRLTGENVAATANRGGRCRWKIENQGFNIQKNGGFNLEHAYSTKNRQIKNLYVLLQIAHVILQLLEQSNLFGADGRTLFGSLRNLARRLAESLRHYLIRPEALDIEAAAQIQIRLDTS